MEKPFHLVSAVLHREGLVVGPPWISETPDLGWMRIPVIVNAPFGHRERVWSERSDAGGFLLGGDGFVLPFGGSLEGYLVRSVDDSVNYGVREGWLAEQLVPVLGGRPGWS